MSIDWLEVENLEDLMNLCLCPQVNGIEKKHFFSVFLRTLFYLSWNCRNKMLFEGNWIIYEEVVNFNQRVEQFLGSIPPYGPTEPTMKQLEVWTCPPIGWSKVNIDMAFKEGKAALALVKQNATREIIKIASMVTEA